MGSLLKIFLWSYLVSGLISCDNSEGEGEGEGGNSPQKSYEFEITLAPPITLANRNAYKVEGTCSNKDKGVITLSVGALPPQEITCDQNYRWQLTIDVSEINTGGNIPIIVTGLDKPIDELRVELDIIPPQVTITPGSIINRINHENYQIAGTCDEVDGKVVLDVGDIAVEAICDGNGYVADQINLSGLDAAVAEVSVTADLKDKLGNPAPQATVSLIRDIILPGVSPLTRPLSLVKTSSIPIPFREDAPRMAQVWSQ